MLDLLLNFLVYLLHGADTARPPADRVATTTATVVRVIDGDTIDVDYNGAIERVRYIGIDTPELYAGTAPECFATAATAANRDWLAGGEVQLIPDTEDRDAYNRLLRYVYVDDVFINAELVRGGFATALPIAPNTEHARAFQSLEAAAKAQSVGLWDVCTKK